MIRLKYCSINWKYVLIILSTLVAPSLSQRKAIRYCINITPSSLICDHEENDLADGVSSQVQQNEFPHLALIGVKKANSNDKSWLCIGALISNRFVLTSAHCVRNSRTTRPTFVIKLGARTANQTENILELESEQVFIHPEYKPPEKYNDIALISLNADITLTKNIRPACINTENNITDEKVLLTTMKTDSDINLFWKWTLNHVSIEECNTLFVNESNSSRLKKGISFESQQCWRLKQNTCQQFITGVVQVYHKKVRCMYDIYGTGNFRHLCKENGPFVYTNIQHYLNWIENIVWP